MALIQNKIELIITDKELIEALHKARENKFIDNLRSRAPFVKFDCLIRGYLGEICFRKWLSMQGCNIMDANIISTDKRNIDIDLTIVNDYLNDIKLELKTSLIPDKDENLTNVFAKRDIKIIKREEDSHLISSDFHVQIYFNQLTKKRDEAMERLAGNPTEYKDEELIQKMRLDTLEQVLVAWIDKSSLNYFLDSTNKKTWNFPGSMQDFWSCPLSSVAKNASDLPNAIKQYRRD